MLVPGSSIVSMPTRLLEAAYERAWFFEGGAEDEEQRWTVYEGLGPECIAPPGHGTSTAIDDIRFEKSGEYSIANKEQTPTPPRCAHSASILFVYRSV